MAVFDDFEGQDLLDGDDKSGMGLDLPSLLFRQLDRICQICNREFHDGILLYNQDGSPRLYLMNVKDSFINSIRNLTCLLRLYNDKDYDSDVVELDKIVDPVERSWKLYEAGLKLVKRINLLPKPFKRIERIKPKKVE